MLAGLLFGVAARAQPAAAANAAGGVEARARAALADPRYQRALPNQPDPKEEPDARPERVGAPSASAAVPLPVLGAGAAISKLVFVVMLIVVVALVAFWIVQAIPRRRTAEEAAAPAPAGDAAGAAGPELSFEDAARLAAEGRYAEAVHALLLAAIRHFAARTRTAIQPSRTSRELVRTLPLAPDAREAFADLVRTVELSLFGGEPLGAEEYERNLERFRALTRRVA